MRGPNGTKWLAAAFAFAVALTGGALPADAKLPPEAADKPGYLIVGTYLIHKDALTKQTFAAAKTTMKASGQGTYYKSEFADGAWFDLSRSVEFRDIADPKGKKAVSATLIEQLKLEIWIDGQGEIHSLLPADELSKRVEQLKKEADKLKKDSQTAVEDNKPNAATQQSLEQNRLEAGAAFLEALAGGKQEEASKLLGRMGDPMEALADLQTKASALGDTLGEERKKLEVQLKQAEAAGDTKLAEELQAKLKASEAAAGPLGQPKDAAAAAVALEALKAKQAELEQLAGAAAKSGNAKLTAELQAQAAANQAALEAEKRELKALLTAELTKQAASLAKQLAEASAAKDTASEAKLLAQWAGVEAQRKAIDSGLAEKLESLEEAMAKLETAVSGQNGTAQQELEATLTTLRKQWTGAKKRELFLQLNLVESATGEAAGKVASELITELKALEKSLYTADEYKALEQLAEQISTASAGQVVPLPVENLLTDTVSLKFEMPPVRIGGAAYIHIRPVSEAFGALVVWNDEERTVTISKAGAVLFCRVDRPEANLNGTPVTLDSPPRLVEGRTMVPLRFVAEGLGLGVTWHEPSATIRIDGFDE
ncbi:copper amine oxidase N-terminal domain-containing protein [Paenibacillus elgii]|uniref:copper amine oxidase N-terminal domain-containing protein n=1 Tax=Paenibacillus elgii TaxID=189691 RepID=UPI0013CF5106|nr:copper amine oxidase N-terminal domain-containing protein [Paenibacillus elgii]